MTLPPAQYIATRKEEILKQIEHFKIELAQLEVMESALRRGPFVGAAAATATPSLPPENQPRRRRVEGGIKGRVMELLIAYEPGKGMAAKDILVALELIHGLELPRTSLSPQLSRLGADGLVEKNNGIWMATELGRQTYSEKHSGSDLV